MKIIIIVQLDFNVCTHRLMEVDDQNLKKKERQIIAQTIHFSTTLSFQSQKIFNLSLSAEVMNKSIPFPELDGINFPPPVDIHV